MSSDYEIEASINSPIETESDEEYKRQLALFSNCSTEKGIELVKVGEVIAPLTHRRSFLDIGAGGGNLTIPISQSFAETTVVEPNIEQVAFFRRRCPHFTVCNHSWEDVNLGSNLFDFIFCSHVLYYIAEGRWLSTINKMYSHLEDKGRIAIVLQSPIGQVADFFNQFTRYDVNILELWRDLIRDYGDGAVEVRYFMNEIFTDTLSDMVSIGLFLLLDHRFKQYENEIAKYFETHHKVAGGYRITQDEILLVVKKV
jgi:SAM-dependent methyltransferase